MLLLLPIVTALGLRSASAAPPDASARPAIAAASSAPSERPAAAAKGATGGGPQKVTVGIYLRQLEELDLKSNSYVAGFYLWFLWKGDIDPTRTFELTNAIGRGNIVKVPVYTDASGASKPEELPDGRRYQVFQIEGRFGHPFDIHEYPFDSQDIVIDIEDVEYETDQLVYEVDPEGRRHMHTLTLPGWTLVDTALGTRETRFSSAFGDPRVAAGKSVYSGVTYSAHLARPFLGLFTKTMLPIVIVVLITLCAFLLDPKETSARIGLIITALISDVALQLSTSSDLPSAGYMVLLDKIYLLSYVIILCATLESVIASRAHEAGQIARANRVDRITMAALGVAFFGIAALIVATR